MIAHDCDRGRLPPDLRARFAPLPDDPLIDAFVRAIPEIARLTEPRAGFGHARTVASAAVCGSPTPVACEPWITGSM